MLLIELGAGNSWTVLAACDSNGNCQVLDFIAGLDQKRRNKMLADLRQYIPNSQPRDWVRCDFSKQLNGVDGILEFCWRTGRGGTPRVFWFYDRGNRIVCTHAIDKKGKLSNAEIQHAAAVKARYDAAVREGKVTIEKLNQDENDE